MMGHVGAWGVWQVKLWLLGESRPEATPGEVHSRPWLAAFVGRRWRAFVLQESRTSDITIQTDDRGSCGSNYDEHDRPCDQQK
ncbi:Imidazolonepropionase [Fusarium oxysporum f. sp. albedinis]|nr:Imidazolonepropionase [Fusarium oxysporum f. sp. albedinis]